MNNANLAILASIGLALVVIGIVLSFGSLITDNVQDEITDNTSTAYNVTVDTLDALAQLSGWLGLIVLVLIGAFIIMILRGAFGGIM